jgi:hypothetical protein
MSRSNIVKDGINLKHQASLRGLARDKQYSIFVKNINMTKKKVINYLYLYFGLSTNHTVYPPVALW